MKLYTIGHSNHPIDTFIQLLEDNGIMLLADVRSAPYSRFHPQFNKENLANVLSDHLIEYAYAGKYLGGRPNDPSCYKNRALPAEETDFLHEVDYQEVMQRDWFRQGIQRLLELADENLTAILCSEEDPAHCHRHHLIAKYLLENHPEVDVQHIRGDGTVYSARSVHTSVNKPPAEQLSLF
jgi:uncharacterized protein (DUF488 family)